MRILVRASALLVVDVQKDFCEFGFAYDRSGRDLTPIRTMVHDRLHSFLARARDAHLPIVYLAAHYARDKFLADGFSELCLEGTPGAELYLLQPNAHAQNEHVLFKSELNAFSNPELHRHLVEKGVQQVLITGVTTGKCVRETAIGALNLAYRVILVSDLVAAAAHRRREHEDTLELFRAQEGAVVIPSIEIEFQQGKDTIHH